MGKNKKMKHNKNKYNKLDETMI